jgi:type IV secretory pathway VirB10-like protein
MERAMADDIDRHWFQRYGSIAIASAMEGISQAAIINAQTGKVTQSGNGVWGTTVIERDPIDSTTEAKIAAGKVGAALGQKSVLETRMYLTPSTHFQTSLSGSISWTASTNPTLNNSIRSK